MMCWIYTFVLLLAITTGSSGQAAESRQPRSCPTDKELELIQAQTRILVSISENLRSVNTRLDKLGQEVARLRSRCSFRVKKYRRNWRTTRNNDELRRIKTNQYQEPVAIKPTPISEDLKPIYTPNSKYIYDVPNSQYDQVLTEINSNDCPSVTLAVQNIGDVNYMNFKIGSQDFLNRIGGSMLTITRNVDTKLYDITVGDGCYTRNKRSLSLGVPVQPSLTEMKNNQTERSEFGMSIENGDIYVDRVGVPLKLKLDEVGDEENSAGQRGEHNNGEKGEDPIEEQHNTEEQPMMEQHNTEQPMMEHNKEEQPMMEHNDENTKDQNIRVGEQKNDEQNSKKQSGERNAKVKSKERNTSDKSIK